jgi:thioredoxin-like negative regulator of GroEL
MNEHRNLISAVDEANRFLSGGHWEEAQDGYLGILKKDPRNSAAHFGLGTIAFHQGRYADAEVHLKRVEEGTPGAETVPKMMAMVWFELMPLPDLSAAEARLQNNPSDSAGLLARGLAYAQGRQYEKALEELLQALEADPAAREGEAKRAFLSVVEIVGRESEIGRKFSRRLSMVICS